VFKGIFWGYDPVLYREQNSTERLEKLIPAIIVEEKIHDWKEDSDRRNEIFFIQQNFPRIVKMFEISGWQDG
jgi:hypothetical protein